MHTSNDIPMDCYQLMKQFAPGQPECEGLIFDFTWLLHYGEPQLWSVLTMTNVQKAGLFMSQLPKDFTYDQMRDALIDTLMATKTWESDFDIYNRGQTFKKFIRQYLLSSPLPVGEKLAIVCHSKFICSLTASGCKGDDEHSEMVDFKWLSNCQTIGWSNY
jgi:hypothetical protein